MRTSNAGRFAAAVALAVFAIVAGHVRAAEQDVKVASKYNLGSYLTDAKGMSLYTFKKDSPGKSACAGDCVTRWPLFYREKVGVSGDLKASDFGTITRDDGQKQTTFKGMPLYYFAMDKAPGDTTGHDVKEVWYLAKP